MRTSHTTGNIKKYREYIGKKKDIQVKKKKKPW